MARRPPAGVQTGYPVRIRFLIVCLFYSCVYLSLDETLALTKNPRLTGNRGFFGKASQLIRTFLPRRPGASGAEPQRLLAHNSPSALNSANLTCHNVTALTNTNPPRLSKRFCFFSFDGAS